MKKVFSKALNAAFSLVLVSGLMPVAANAEAIAADNGADSSAIEAQSNVEAQDATWIACGTCEWTIDDSGTLTIRPADGATTGTLDNWGYLVANVPWHSSAASIAAVSIQEGVSAATCYGMFDGCTSLTSLDLTNLNTADVTDMTRMFNGCNALSSLNISSLNTAKVTSMSRMFYNCYALTSLDVSKFNTAQVEDMNSMFLGCHGLLSLDVSSFNTSKVTTMNAMFGQCYALTTLDISNFDTSKVENMMSMFTYCWALTSLNVSTLNTSNVTNMSAMFEKCSSLTSLDLSAFNTAKVSHMTQMFYNCSSLKTIYVGSGFTTESLMVSDDMFGGCYSLVGGANTAYSAERVDGTYAHIDGGTDNPGYFTTKPVKGSGDANNNGVVNIVDAQVAYDIAAHDAYKDRADYAEMCARADVTGDGSVLSADAFAIQYYVMTGTWGE